MLEENLTATMPCLLTMSTKILKIFIKVTFNKKIYIEVSDNCVSHITYMKNIISKETDNNIQRSWQFAITKNNFGKIICTTQLSLYVWRRNERDLP